MAAKTRLHGFVTQSLRLRGEHVSWLLHGAVHDSSCPLVCERGCVKATAPGTGHHCPIHGNVSVTTNCKLSTRNFCFFWFVVCCVCIFRVSCGLQEKSKQYISFSKTIITMNIIFRSLVLCCTIIFSSNIKLSKTSSIPLPLQDYREVFAIICVRQLYFCRPLGLSCWPPWVQSQA